MMNRRRDMPELEDAFFDRVTGLVLNELADVFPDPADRAAALLGLAVTEVAAIEDRDERRQLCIDAYRAFYFGSLGHPIELDDGRL
jgi:hypothetical protein